MIEFCTVHCILSLSLIVCDFVFVYFGWSVSCWSFILLCFFFVARYAENKFITSSIKSRIIFVKYWKYFVQSTCGNNDDILVQFCLSRQNPIPWNYGTTKVLRNLNKVNAFYKTRSNFVYYSVKSPFSISSYVLMYLHNVFDWHENITQTNFYYRFRF